jgi:hypothetical protein
MGVAGSYALARVEPAAGDRPGEMVELQVPLIPSIAADSRRLFWFAQGAVTPALMVDER